MNKRKKCLLNPLALGDKCVGSLSSFPFLGSVVNRHGFVTLCNNNFCLSSWRC